MDTHVLLYNDFVDFEIALLLLLLRGKSDIHTFTVDDEIVSSYGGLRIKSDMDISAVNPEAVDLLIIPGGEPGSYNQRSDIQNLLTDINKRRVPIAAICGGPEFLAQAGILNGKKMTHGHNPEYAQKVFANCTIVDEDVVIDGNIITARGQAFAEFAVSTCQYLGFFEHEDEARETLNYLKNVH